jgi:hydroxyacylglutathione hydrolase
MRPCPSIPNRGEKMQSVVQCEVTGPGETNSYLLYDIESGEAALFDVGGPVEVLASVIDKNSLSLKYIFNTHAHVDHVWGVPEIRLRYPDARWCLSKEEFEDIRDYEKWEVNLPAGLVAQMRAAAAANEETARMLSFDFSRLGAPDIFAKDRDVFYLGALPINTFLTPGHSRGSLSFHAPGSLFSGDLLFYLTVGRALPRSGGPEQIVQSVRRLYACLPDETKVYPGHQRSTDIGHERRHNERVSETHQTVFEAGGPEQAPKG